MLARQQNVFFVFCFFKSQMTEPHWHTFWNLYSFFIQNGASDHVDVLLLMLLAWRGGWVGKLPVDLSCIFKIHTRNNLWTLVFMFIIVSFKFLIKTHFFFLILSVSSLPLWCLWIIVDSLSRKYHDTFFWSHSSEFGDSSDHFCSEAGHFFNELFMYFYNTWQCISAVFCFVFNMILEPKTRHSFCFRRNPSTYVWYVFVRNRVVGTYGPSRPTHIFLILSIAIWTSHRQQL